MISLFRNNFPNINFLENQDLKSYSTFHAGASSSIFTSVQNLEDFINIIKFARQNNIKYIVLGGGTNLVFKKGLFEGIVIKNLCQKSEIVLDDQAVGYIFAESGAITHQLSQKLLENSLSGLEYAYGLPGTIGAAVVYNANYPKENRFVGENVLTARILTEDGEIQEVDHEYFEFGFDHSSIKKTKSTLLDVKFRVKKVNKENLEKLCSEVMKYRAETKPKFKGNGITFRNIMTNLKNNNLSIGQEDPAQYLINNSAEYTGDNPVSFSEDNPRYILNLNNGSIEDIEEMISRVKKRVFDKYGELLEINTHNYNF